MAFSFSDTCLITPTQFSRLFFGVDDGTTGLTAVQIANYESLVNAASQQILDYLGRNIKSATYTHVYDGNGSDAIMLSEYPVTAVSSVKFSATNDFASAQALPSTSWGFNENEVVILGGHTPRGRNMVQVVYTAGYSTVPYSLQLACKIQFDLLNKLTNPGAKGAGAMLGVQSMGKMGETTTKDNKLSEHGLASEVVGLIQPFRRFEAPRHIMFMRTN